MPTKRKRKNRGPQKKRVQRKDKRPRGHTGHPNNLERNGNQLILLNMGRVGSISISRNVGFKSTYELHAWGPNDSRDSTICVPVPELKAKRNKKLIAQLARAKPNNPLKALTIVRNLCDRLVSAFFFSLSLGKSVAPSILDIPHSGETHSPQDFQDYMLNNFDWKWTLDWFEKSFEPFLGINVYNYPFPHEKGWLLIEKDDIRLLILRTEELNSVWEEAGPKLLGQKVKPMGHTNKTGTTFYDEFKKHGQLPQEIVDTLLDSKLMRHFYTETERKAFRAKWTNPMDKLAHDIVFDIIDELTDRSGIGNAWWEIDEDIREEIISTLESKVKKNLEQNDETLVV